MFEPLDPDNCDVQYANSDNTYPKACVEFIDGRNDGSDSVRMCIAGTFLPEGCREKCCGDDATMFPTEVPVAQIITPPPVTIVPTPPPASKPATVPIDKPTVEVELPNVVPVLSIRETCPIG
jgi:hypothetical protein